ncbi:MAG: discoidin domain-containing protein, partial [Roseburia sp.]|nr:discoidin domain-containing protein [Roseburia sp.]
VTIYPNQAVDKDGMAAGFPKDFTIETSVDGQNFVVSHTETDYPAPSTGQAVDIQFEPVEARYVKLNVTELGTPSRLTPSGYMLSLSEIEVGIVSESETLDLSIAQHIDFSKNIINPDNVVIGYYDKEGAFVESTIPFWSNENLIDGDKNSPVSTGYLGYPSTNGIADYKPAIEVDVSENGRSVSVSAVELSVRMVNGSVSCYPIDFDIQITNSISGNWTTVASYEDYDWSKSDTALFTFNPVAAYKVRLYVRDYGYDVEQNTWMYCQLTEMAIYKPADLAKGAAVTAPNSWEYEEGGLSKDNLTAGTFSTFYTSEAVAIATALDAPVTVDLGSVQAVGGVRLYPRSGNLHYVKDMRVEVSTDGNNYTTVLDLQNIIAPDGDCQFFCFPEAVDARYVRIVPTEIQNGEENAVDGVTYYRLQLMALEVAPATQISDEPVDSQETLIDRNPIPEGIITQAGATKQGETYHIDAITAKNDNVSHDYNAEKAIDGLKFSQVQHLGYIVPESYNLEKVGNIEDVEINVLRWWYHRILKVDSVSEDGTEVYFADFTLSNAQSDNFSDRISWLENAYEFIDQPGEWYIDKKTSTIYYKPNGDMSGKKAVLPITEQLLVFDGCQNVIFDGVTFEYTTWTKPNESGYIDCQSGTYISELNVGRLDGAWGEVPGGIEIGESSNIKITNCEIRNFGGGGIRILNGSESNEISNSAIHDISSCGIWVGNMYGHGTPCDEGTLVKDNVIRNNYITRVGLDIYDSSAIVALFTEGTIIDHNEISYTPYTGITLGWGWDWMDVDCVKNNIVSNNYVHDTGITTHDGASIYTLGDQPGSKIYGNYVHTHSDALNNLDAGIYLDEGTTGIELYDNVVGSGVYWWSNMNAASVQNNYWHDNYHQVESGRDTTTENVMENSIFVPDGNFEDYPQAQAIIDNAGLLDNSVKHGVTEGIAAKHNISLTKYLDGESYYFTKDNGLTSFTIPGQVGNTQYNWSNYEIEILVPEGTDLTSLVPVIELEAGYTSDKDADVAQDFTNPVIYTLTNGDRQIMWTVRVKVDVTASGPLTGIEVTLDDAIKDTENWTVTPVINEDGSITFNNGFSGYLGECFTSDTILEFDMISALNMESKDWLGYALNSQDPYTMLGTMYHVCFNNGSIELQKWVNGERTMLYGTIEGYTPVYGDLANDFYTPNERHSIKTGAVEVPSGVRLFLYVDGNKVFDVIDTDNPISSGGYFVVYPMTQSITLMGFSDIQNNPVDFSELETAIKSGEAVEEDNYTAETYEVVKEALKKAKEVLDDADATQDEVDAAVKALNDAIAELEKKTDEDGNNGNEENAGNTGNTENTGNSGGTGNTGNTGNTGSTDNSGDTGNSDNSGNTGNTGNSGNTGNNTGGTSGSDTNNTSGSGTSVIGNVTSTSDSTSPQTGDNFNVIGVVVISILAFTMIVLAVVQKRRGDAREIDV